MPCWLSAKDHPCASFRSEMHQNIREQELPPGLIVILKDCSHRFMQELITEQSNNWLQLYVDAMTEKNPMKRLALVRQLRQIPRHDESNESTTRPRLQLVPEKASAMSPKEVQSVAVTTRKPKIESLGIRVERNNRKPKAGAKAARRGGRLRTA
jgi:hypothetical protein